MKNLLKKSIFILIFLSGFFCAGGIGSVIMGGTRIHTGNSLLFAEETSIENLYTYFTVTINSLSISYSNNSVKSHFFPHFLTYKFLKKIAIMLSFHF